MNLFYYLEALPWIQGALITVGIFVLFAIVGILIVRHFVSPKTLKAHHDVAGVVFTNLGVLYGVLLGFTVVNVQQRFDKINGTIEIEASYLAELYQDSAVFDTKDRDNIRNSLKIYGEGVINHEWNMMAANEIIPNNSSNLKNIWNSYYTIEPRDNKQQAWYAESISKLNLLMNARLQRLLGSQESLGTEMWSLLIIGGLLMVAFMWLFGMENLLSHILMASLLASTTAFLLFLIYSLDTAYTGGVSIPPEALQKVVSSFAD